MLRTVSKLGDLAGRRSGEKRCPESAWESLQTWQPTPHVTGHVRSQTGRHNTVKMQSVRLQEKNLKAVRKDRSLTKERAFRLPSEFLFATTRQIVFQNTKGNCQPRITYQTGSRAKVNKDYSRHAHMLIMNRTLWGKKWQKIENVLKLWSTISAFSDQCWCQSYLIDNNVHEFMNSLWYLTNIINLKIVIKWLLCSCLENPRQVVGCRLWGCTELDTTEAT